MNRLKYICLSFGLTLMGNVAAAQAVDDPPLASTATNAAASTNTFIGWATNGASIVQQYRMMRPWKFPFPTNNPAFATNAVVQRMMAAHSPFTNLVFAGFLPESLNHLIWTNFIAHTNGRDMVIWSQRAHPNGWPSAAPLLQWNTNNLMWGMKGLTALSPCWEGEGSPGQVPITLLTRRHGFTRGHSMGAEGFNTASRGLKVWFLATDNSLVTATIRRQVVRAGQKGDYTIFLFDRDLPAKIVPLRVVAPAEVQARYTGAARGGGNCPIFKTEQLGHVSAEVPGFTYNTWKGGDSGSPNLLPLPGELVFFGGRSTSPPSAAMQADMDELSRQQGLKPKAYQLQWVDLSKYPKY